VPKATPLPLKAYQTLANFRYAVRQYLHFSEKEAKRKGLTPRQYQAILAIKAATDKEPLGVGDLARILFLHPHSAVGLVNRLEVAGLVSRRPAAHDKRRALLELTPRGTGILEKLVITHRGELRRISPVFRGVIEEITSRP